VDSPSIQVLVKEVMEEVASSCVAGWTWLGVSRWDHNSLHDSSGAFFFSP
jgi:hypothetical protein